MEPPDDRAPVTSSIGCSLPEEVKIQDRDPFWSGAKFAGWTEPHSLKRTILGIRWAVVVIS
jgi:hypothetical protein